MGALRACSVVELASYIWYSKENSKLNFKSLQVFNRYVDRILQQMYAAGKVSWLNFRTEKGKIFGLSIEDYRDYIFRNDLVPEKLVDIVCLIRKCQRLIYKNGKKR